MAYDFWGRFPCKSGCTFIPMVLMNALRELVHDHRHALPHQYANAQPSARISLAAA